MMKHLLLFLLIALGLGSCSITQEIVITEDGRVNYLNTIDGSALMSMMAGAENKGEPVDSVMSLEEIVTDKKDLDSMSPEERQLFEDVKNMVVSVRYQPDRNEMFIGFSGEFADVETMNTALTSARKLNNMKKGNTLPGDRDMGELNQILDRYSHFDWDGKILTVTSAYDEADKLGEEAEEKEISMLAGGKLKRKYTLPRKVVRTNNPNAYISSDGRTVVVDYMVEDFIANPSLTDIVIETE